MWRWFIAIGLAAAVTTVHVILNRPYILPPHGQYFVGALTVSWIFGFVAASPTILYYRLLIWLGEHGLRRWPLAGAAVAVAAGAILPPFAYNLAAERSRAERDFLSPAAANVGTIAIDQYGSDSWLQEGFAKCGEECLRLLYGGVARQVIFGDPAARVAYDRRSVVSGDEPREYPTAYVLRLERRSICPPVALNRGRTGDARFPGGILVDAHAPSPWDGRAVDDRAIALMAAGNCIVSSPASFDDADLHLGSSDSYNRSEAPLQPDRFGTDGTQFEFVDAQTGQGWRRLSQRISSGLAIRWTYPFGFLRLEQSWIAKTGTYDEGASSNTRESPGWQWAGIRRPDLPETDVFEVRRLLQAAVAMPPERPRDARHLLVWQYLLQLSRRPIDAVDRALIERIILDPRVPESDLQMLPRVAKQPGAPQMGLWLLRRIGKGDARLAANRLIELPREQWPALLPEVRKLAAEAVFTDDLSALFGLFAVGTPEDRALLLRQLEREWPPRSLANYRHPVPDSVRDEAEVNQNRLSSYLSGLCALGDDKGVVRERLFAASEHALPRRHSADQLVKELWQTMFGMGIPVERLIAERGADPETREEILWIYNQGYQVCGGKRFIRPSRADNAERSSFPGYRGNLSRALFFDAMILLSILAGITVIAVVVVKRRRRGKITPG